MKKIVLSTFVIMLFIATGIQDVDAQNNNRSERDILIENMLSEKPYHIDLPEYRKADTIINKLLDEVALTVQEIELILDDMVNDPTPVDKQILIRFYNMPVYTDTGDPEKDKEIYKKAMDEWIKNNPEKYQEINNKK